MKNKDKKIDKKIVILGSTGSVGRQTVEVADDLGAEVIALVGSRSVDIIESQARLLHPRYCVLQNESAAKELKIKLADTDIEVRSGDAAILEAATESDADIVFNSISQSHGLESTLAAVNAGKTLALANKESLVMAGDIVMSAARNNNAKIIPVDSEHSAIYQCLIGHKPSDIKSILLTASGGPFFGKSREELKAITPELALAHPTWKMGPRVTIDSATLMNKGFEVIEAVHLFGVSVEQVEVIIHRESIIHSMVEYNDNAVIAQLSVPDMRLCAHYALTSPNRVEGIMKPLKLTDIGTLTFYKPDVESFPLLGLAIEAIKAGGILSAVMNAADEVAVEQFISGKIGFNDISDIVCSVVRETKNITSPTLSEIKAASSEAGRAALAMCEKLHR